MTCGKPCNCPSYRDHLLSVAFAPSAQPSRHPDAAEAKKIGQQWAKDLPAYKRLVESGLQPPSTAGTAELEARADLPSEVETGQVMTKKQRAEFRAVSTDLPGAA